MKILLVDDEALALRALEKRVNWAEYGFNRVFTAQSAAEARQLLAGTHIDLVVCDIEMPEENGLSLVRFIRDAYPDTACIMVTCHADFSYLKQAMHSKVIDYILKPVDYEELGKLLTGFVRERAKAGQGQATQPAAAAIGDEEKDSAERQLARVQKYINEHLSEKIYVADLAKLVHLNEQYFMRVFKRSTGKTVTEYVTERRLQRGRELLISGSYSIQHIADITGFETVSYFTKLFKGATGLTPREYRIKFGSMPDL